MATRTLRFSTEANLPPPSTSLAAAADSLLAPLVTNSAPPPEVASALSLASASSRFLNAMGAPATPFLYGGAHDALMEASVVRTVASGDQSAMGGLGRRSPAPRRHPCPAAACAGALRSPHRAPPSRLRTSRRRRDPRSRFSIASSPSVGASSSASASCSRASAAHGPRHGWRDCQQRGLPHCPPASHCYRQTSRPRGSCSASSTRTRMSRPTWARSCLLCWSSSPPARGQRAVCRLECGTLSCSSATPSQTPRLCAWSARACRSTRAPTRARSPPAARSGSTTSGRALGSLWGTFTTPSPLWSDATARTYASSWRSLCSPAFWWPPVRLPHHRLGRPQQPPLSLED